MSKPKRGRPFGHEVSKATRDKIGAKSAGKIPVNRRMVSINTVVYESIQAASNATGVNHTTIRHRLLSDSERFKEWIYL
jgi:hypothetical protein